MHINREEIEKVLMNYNKILYQKGYNTKVYKNEIYNKLKEKKMHEKIL